MKYFLIKVKCDTPYPIEFEYRQGGSNMRAAVGRAIKSFRNEERMKRKKIDNLLIKVTKI